MSVQKGVFTSFGRGALLAAAAATALVVTGPSAVMAGSATPSALSVDHGAGGATDISAARRRHYGGGAAGIAAFAGIVGTIGAIAAAQERRDYYESGPVYYDAPAYYGPGYGYSGYSGYHDPYHYHRYSRGGF